MQSAPDCYRAALDVQDVLDTTLAADAPALVAARDALIAMGDLTAALATDSTTAEN